MHTFQCTKKLRATLKKYYFYPIKKIYFEKTLVLLFACFVFWTQGLYVLDDLTYCIDWDDQLRGPSSSLSLMLGLTMYTITFI